MKVILKTFAALKDELGNEIDVEVNDNTKVSDLIALLNKKYSNLSEIISSSRIASNDGIFEVDDKIPSNTELYILPPSSGG